MAGYGIADAYTKDEVDAKMSSALEYKGSKDTYADLPTTGNKKGDVWNIVNAAHGNTWALRQQVRDRVQNILKEEI